MQGERPTLFITSVLVCQLSSGRAVHPGRALKQQSWRRKRKSCICWGRWGESDNKTKQTKQNRTKHWVEESRRMWMCWRGKDKLATVVSSRTIIPFTDIASEANFSGPPWDQARRKVYDLLCRSSAFCIAGRYWQQKNLVWGPAITANAVPIVDCSAQEGRW